MSTPFSVSHVGFRPLEGGEPLEVVGAHVGDRLAGTFVVEAGHGEPLAKLLLSAAIVDAARRAVEIHRGTGGLEELVGALDELAAAVADVDAEPPARELPIRRLEPIPLRPVENVRPDDMIVEASNRLFFGNPEGKTGNSIFRAVVVAGTVLVATPSGPRPRSFGSFEGNFEEPECWTALEWKLRELADGIEAQRKANDLVRGR